MASRGADVLILAVFSAAVMLTNLGGARLWDRDEPRNAGCATEMASRGDWVVPVFNGQLRAHKPVLLYWGMMLSYALFGVNEFAARLPSAGCALGTIFLTHAIAWRLMGRHIAFWSGAILATCLMFGVVGRAATPDSLLIFLTTAALATYVFATWPVNESDQPGGVVCPFPTSTIAAIAIYGWMGLAVLAKGPVGLVLPTAVIGVFCLIVRLRVAEGGTSAMPHGIESTEVDSLRGRWSKSVGYLLSLISPRHFFLTCWSMKPITALATVALVAGPWYVWVGVRTDGAWLRGFFLDHNVGRALQPMEGHGGSVLFYPLSLLVAFFPWSVLAIGTLLSIQRRIKRRIHYDATLFLVGWILVYIGLFSLARTKLPSYIAPCFPACAILLATYVAELARTTTVRQQSASLSRSVDQRWWLIGAWTLSGVGLVLAIGAWWAGRQYLPDEPRWGLAALGVIGIVPCLGGVCVARWANAGRWSASAATLLIVAFTMGIVLFGVLSQRVSKHQAAIELLSDANRAGYERVGSFGLLEPSWVFYLGRPIEEIGRDRPEIAVEFLRQSAENDRRGALITTRRRLEELQEATDIRFRVVGECPYFLRREQLVMVDGGSEPRLATQTFFDGASR